MRRLAALVLSLAIGCVGVAAQQSSGAESDAEVVAASRLVGKGLFLRGFYLTNDLTYDSAGRVQGSPKVGDWTVAAVNVLKAQRRGPDEIELEGVRAPASLTFAQVAGAQGPAASQFPDGCSSRKVWTGRRSIR